MFRKSGRIMILWLALGAGAQAQSPQPGPSPEQKEFQSLDEQVQGLKEEVIKINREMLLLQEKLLYPSSSQISIFVSLESSDKFSLDTIALKLDERQVQRHLYTYRELEALRKQGVQRLYTGNLINGKHKLAVAVSGKTSSNNTYQQSAEFPLDKALGPKLVEIRVISGSGGKPKLVLQEWK